MRRIFGVAIVVLGMMVGVRGAVAQLVDPSTGIMVDAATDPMDFSAVASGQPGNVGIEAMMAASAQMQAQMDASAASSNAMTDSLNASDASAAAPAAPALPRTPAPVMTPNGGKFKGSVQVTIADSDAAAAVFYTVNGKKPTMSSPRYAGAITVSAKTKVEALAFDVNMQPSGVVSKKFRVRS
jgi:hypothetical protein